jgi:ribosomal-protein-alanine N-acetyltransferase
MIEEEAEALAALHASAFKGASRWSAEAFSQALADPRCFFVPGWGSGEGFALGRIAADEAELLTLVVAPAVRRQGKGRQLVARFEDIAQSRGAVMAFLEVAADNLPARSLYEGAQWRTIGTRPGYYAGRDAIMMRKDLSSI